MSNLAESRHSILAVYNPPELLFSHGKGCYLYSQTGEAYLDFTAGIAVNALGHAHPHLVATLTAQAQKLWHVSNMFRIESGERLARRLTEQTFAQAVFFANSGAEANECALKAARRYQFDQGKVDKYRIIGMHNAFHGRSLATIAAAGNPDYTKGFIPHDYHYEQGYDHVPFNDLPTLEQKIADNQGKTAAIIIEPIQGEGGIQLIDMTYLRAVRELCDAEDIVLIFDEVQCGLARTGTLYAYQQLGVEPDILTTAKGLGGGFPIGACLLKSAVAQSMVVGTHGSTFGGNPLATAVGNAVFDVVLEPAFLPQVNRVAQYLKSELSALSDEFPHLFGAVSGLGLMLGLNVHEQAAKNTDLVTTLREKHQVLIAKAGNNSLRFLPPLIVTEAEINPLIDALRQVARTL